jgi:hypothetical protein
MLIDIMILTLAGMLHVTFLECYRMSHRPRTSFCEHRTGSFGGFKINIIYHCDESLSCQEVLWRMQLPIRYTAHKESSFKAIISFAYKPFLGEIIKKDETVEAHSAHGREAKCILYRTIIIKWILRKWGGMVWIWFLWLKTGASRQ